MSASSRRAGIHPRVMAGFILYGLSLGIRSSRKLEDAAANRLDFIGLLEGRVPDHATICKFRTQFGGQIKGLFKQVGRVAMNLGLVSLNQVMLDGTDIKANNPGAPGLRHPPPRVAGGEDQRVGPAGRADAGRGAGGGQGR